MPRFIAALANGGRDNHEEQMDRLPKQYHATITDNYPGALSGTSARAELAEESRI